MGFTPTEIRVTMQTVRTTKVGGATKEWVGLKQNGRGHYKKG